MIKAFHHKGVERFFTQGAPAGVRSGNLQRLRLQLARLDAAWSPQDMNAKSWRLQIEEDFQAVWVDEKWRLTFRFEGEDAVLLDYQRHHQEPR